MDIIKIYSAVVLQHGGKIEKERLQKLVLSMGRMIADINVRCNKRNALVKSTFLGCFETMKVAASASLEVLDKDFEGALVLIAHLLEYELLYTETLLSSPLSSDTQSTLFPFSLVSKFYEFFSMNSTGKWVFEKFLVTKCLSEDVEFQLFNLIQKKELLLVIKILMMEEYPNIDKFRAFKARERFLSNGGIEIIKNGLPSIEYFWLMLAASKNSIELKYKLSIALDLREISASMPATIDSVHILLELSTNGGYLEQSDYIAKISSVYPYITSDVLLQVTQPHYLFNPISHSRHSSTATSTFHLLDKSQLMDISLNSIPIVAGSYILAVLILIPKCSIDLQLEILKKILSLSKSYENKQTLCSLQFSKLLLQSVPKLNPGVYEAAYAILTNLLSYSVTSEEAGILLENLSNPFIQKILSSCLALDLHSAFYVLQNQALDTPTITNFSKSGYTLMFWVKIQKVTSDLTSIFSWVDHNRGLVLFKLAIMHAGDKKMNSLDYMRGTLISDCGSYFIIQAPTQPVFPAPDETAKYNIETTND